MSDFFAGLAQGSGQTFGPTLQHRLALEEQKRSAMASEGIAQHRADSEDTRIANEKSASDRRLGIEQQNADSTTAYQGALAEGQRTRTKAEKMRLAEDYTPEAVNARLQEMRLKTREGIAKASSAEVDFDQKALNADTPDEVRARKKVGMDVLAAHGRKATTDAEKSAFDLAESKRLAPTAEDVEMGRRTKAIHAASLEAATAASNAQRMHATVSVIKEMYPTAFETDKQLLNEITDANVKNWPHVLQLAGGDADKASLMMMAGNAATVKARKATLAGLDFDEEANKAQFEAVLHELSNGDPVLGKLLALKLTHEAAADVPNQNPLATPTAPEAPRVGVSALTGSQKRKIAQQAETDAAIGLPGNMTPDEHRKLAGGTGISGELTFTQAMNMADYRAGYEKNGRRAATVNGKTLALLDNNALPKAQQEAGVWFDDWVREHPTEVQDAYRRLSGAEGEVTESKLAAMKRRVVAEAIKRDAGMDVKERRGTPGSVIVRQTIFDLGKAQ